MFEGTLSKIGAALGGEIPGQVHFGVQGPPGPDGGHYIPNVNQTNDYTAVISFTPSKNNMPSVDPVQIKLPKNTAASIKAVLYTEQELTAEQKAQVKTNLDIVDCLTVTVDNRWNTSLSAAEIVAAKEKGTIVILNCGILLSEVTASTEGDVVEYADFTTILSGSDQLMKLTVRIVGNKATPTFTEINTGGGGSGGETVQSDWNQTDETAADFIKNRTHGEFFTVVLEEQELPFSPDDGGCLGITSEPLKVGNAVSIVLDGETYNCEVVPSDSFNLIGNLGLIGKGPDTGEPFICICIENILVVMTGDEANHIVKVTAKTTKALPSKYASVAKFYITEATPYIYTDAECTTKAFMEDIPDHSSFSVGLAAGDGIIVYWSNSLGCTSSYYGMLTGFKTISICNMANEIVTYYTAEYTP